MVSACVHVHVAHVIGYDIILCVDSISENITLNPCLLFQPTADVLGCNVYSDGSAAAVDTWNPSGTKTNELDTDKVCIMS